MTRENLRHLRAVGRAAAGHSVYLGSFADVRGDHYRRAYDGELFRIRVTEVIKAVHRASRDAQRLPGTNLDRRAVDRPCQDARDSLEDLLIAVVLVDSCRDRLVWDASVTARTTVTMRECIIILRWTSHARLYTRRPNSWHGRPARAHGRDGRATNGCEIT